MANINLSVPARPHGGYWTNTGIHIDKGDQVKVSYSSGSWQSNPNWQVSDAAGNANHIASGNYLLPGKPEGALVAKIGGGTGWGDRGHAVYYVGNGADIPDDPEGILYLSVNDEEQGFGDNRGAISVIIQF